MQAELVGRSAGCRSCPSCVCAPGSTSTTSSPSPRNSWYALPQRLTPQLSLSHRQSKMTKPPIAPTAGTAPSNISISITLPRLAVGPTSSARIPSAGHATTTHNSHTAHGTRHTTLADARVLVIRSKIRSIWRCSRDSTATRARPRSASSPRTRSPQRRRRRPWCPSRPSSGRPASRWSSTLLSLRAA